MDTIPKYLRYLFVELSLREALEEKATGVFEYVRLIVEHAVDFCFYDIHW